MNSKSKKLLESIKDQIISEVFLNEEVGLADKINFCRQLESLKKFVFDSEIETAREKG